MVKRQRAMSQGGWEIWVPSRALSVRLCYLALPKITFLPRCCGGHGQARARVFSVPTPQGAWG